MSMQVTCNDYTFVRKKRQFGLVFEDRGGTRR